MRIHALILMMSASAALSFAGCDESGPTVNKMTDTQIEEYNVSLKAAEKDTTQQSLDGGSDNGL